MKLSVVIVSYNVRQYLTACIDSVALALKDIEGEVFVVDNNSSDDSVEVIARDYPWVHLINNIENLGFSKANNIAIRQVQSEGRTFIINLKTGKCGKAYCNNSDEFDSKCGWAVAWARYRGEEIPDYI